MDRVSTCMNVYTRARPGETHVLHAKELVASILSHGTGRLEHLFQGCNFGLGLLFLLLLLSILGSRTRGVLRSTHSEHQYSFPSQMWSCEGSQVSWLAAPVPS